MELVSNPFQACNDIFFKPNRVFATLTEKHNWSWLPFFLVSFLTLIPSYFYFNFVDFEWYRELVINTTMADVSPAEQDMVRNSMTRSQTLSFTLISQVLIMIIANAILALYLNFITKMDEENVQGFTDWYGFTWWTSMPVILTSLASVVTIALASDHQLSPDALTPTSLAYLLDVKLGSDWFNLLMGIRLDTFWSMYLITVGVSQWTRIPTKTCYLIGILPYVAIWLIWSLFIVL